MRIFVFEYITGGGMLDCALTPSLANEGDLMLRALVSDLRELDGVEVVITRDARLSPVRLPVECRVVEGAEHFPEVWDLTLDTVDAVWPIAPERCGALERVTEAVLEAGKTLLNSPPCAVRVTASKIGTLRRLAERGIPVVPTYGIEDRLPGIRGRWVLKPDDGVGCLGIRLFQDRDSLRRYWERLPDGPANVAQPYVTGMAASLCILAKEGEATLLSVNRQRIAVMDDAFVLLGCVVSGLSGGGRRYERLAGAIAAALPGLQGYVGVDLIVGPNGPKVLEVNPRLTTSYVGLKESIGVNPAGLVLDLMGGGSAWRGATGAAKAVDVCLEYANVA
jgi:predicted ATP-grasp superfamily ATP-dependent carboligase